MVHEAVERRRPLFSLDGAARIRRTLAQGAPAECPDCGSQLHALVGGAGPKGVWVVRCRVCVRVLIIGGVAEREAPE